MVKGRYSISVLADKAGVTPRTIRYYIDEGLLPPPGTTGRYATYSEEYLIRLRLIKALQDAHLPLKEIGRLIYPLNKEEIHELLTKYENSSPAEAIKDDFKALAEPSSALEYLSKVIEAQTDEPTRPPRQVRQQPISSPAEQSSFAEDDPNLVRRFSLGEGIELTIPNRIYRRHRWVIDDWITIASQNFKKWIKEDRK